MTKKIIFLLSLLFFLFPSHIYAQTTTSGNQLIRISPVILKLNLSPGEVYEYDINVENLLETPLPLQAVVESFDASNEDYGFSISVPQEQSPFTKWLSLDNTDAILEAKDTRTFKLKVIIPDVVPIGSYFSMLFFEPILPRGQVPVNARVGVLVLANIGVTEEINKAQILDFSFKKSINEQNPVTAVIRVRNDSLNFFSAKPTIYIKPLFGQMKSFELEEKTILPGKVRRWEDKLDLDQLYQGIYFARVGISLGDGQIIYQEAQFYGFPISKVLLVLIPLGLFSFVGVFRKRISNALRVFIKG